MTYTPPTVNYSTTINGTYTSLTGIQSVLISRGRQRFQDNFAQTTCTIELIPATSYATPLAVGQFIDVRTINTSTAPCYFAGTITDIQRSYAFPYNSISQYAPGDRITITATGAVGAMAATSFANYTYASNSAVSEITGATSLNGVYTGNSVNNNVTASGGTFSGGAMDFVNQMLRTCQFMIDDLDSKRAGYSGNNYVCFVFPPGSGQAAYTFTDTGSIVPSDWKFSAIEYLSSVQNTFTQVQVAPDGLATQSATSGSAPYNTLVYTTYNSNTADASSLAGYVLATQALNTITPYSITTTTLIAPTCTDISLIGNTNIFAGGPDAMNLGASVTVNFRGTTALAMVQGINTAFYADHASVQLYLSPSLGTPFTLDSSAFGVLDTNRLGYP